MYDAIVVGARCAGSPTAMLLARAGYKVLLVDRATLSQRNSQRTLWSAECAWGIWRAGTGGAKGRALVWHCRSTKLLSQRFAPGWAVVGRFSTDRFFAIEITVCPR